MSEAVYEFYFAFGELLADVDAIRDADHLGVLEFDSCALVAVVQQNVEACGSELGCDGFAGGEKVGLFDVGDGDDDLEGRDSGWQGVAFLLAFLDANFAAEVSMAAVRMRSMPMP